MVAGFPRGPPAKERFVSTINRHTKLSELKEYSRRVTTGGSEARPIVPARMVTSIEGSMRAAGFTLSREHLVRETVRALEALKSSE